MGASDRLHPQAVFRNLRDILRSAPKHVLVLSSDQVYRMDYSRMLDFHRSVDVEVTVATVEVELSCCSSFGIVAVGRQGLGLDFEEKPDFPKALPDNPMHALASMGICLFNRDTHQTRKGSRFPTTPGSAALRGIDAHEAKAATV